MNNWWTLAGSPADGASSHLTSSLLIIIATFRVARFFATFRVARLTLQTRKHQLVGVATDLDAPLTCPNVKKLFTNKNEKKR